MANLKELVSKVNDASERALKRSEELKARILREQALERERAKRLHMDRVNLLGQVVEQTGFTERFKTAEGNPNFPLLIGIILEGMERLEKEERWYDRYLKRYNAFAEAQEAPEEDTEQPVEVQETTVEQ